MKIAYCPQQVNLYRNNKCNSTPVVSCSSPVSSNRFDTFAKPLPFKGRKILSMEWYRNLSPERRAYLSKRVNDIIYHNKEYIGFDKSVTEALMYHDLTANCIKDELNQKFGEGNYIVIPIGRSLSSIGKCLGNKIGDERVKPLPMSRAPRFLDLDKPDSKFEALERTDADFDILKKYLDSIGLSKEEVKKSNKHYIFIDYCNTGRSLAGVKKLFESDKMWGHNDNVQFEDIFNLLPKAETKSEIGGIPTGAFLNELKEMFFNSSYKRFSLVKDCPRFIYLERAVIDPMTFTNEQLAFHYKMMEIEANKAI
ncbi:MAG: hypothetical protein K6E29_07495 [Cyanobacteria bacterium RUI128]|nr:hypothetical protein [Cyanobacteria bacterium RUI128]